MICIRLIEGRSIDWSSAAINWFKSYTKINCQNSLDFDVGFFCFLHVFFLHRKIRIWCFPLGFFGFCNSSSPGLCLGFRFVYRWRCKHPRCSCSGNRCIGEGGIYICRCGHRGRHNERGACESGGDLAFLFCVGFLSQSLRGFLGGLFVTNIAPLASGRVLFQKAAWRIAVSDGTHNDPCHGWLLDLGRSNIIGTVQRNNVSESFVPLVVIRQSSSAAKNICYKKKSRKWELKHCKIWLHKRFHWFITYHDRLPRGFHPCRRHSEAAIP